jgi:hypothetical protein
MWIIATFIKRAPANVVPNALSFLLVLNVYDLNGKVPTITTIKKNKSINPIFSNLIKRLSSIFYLYIYYYLSIYKYYP